MSTQTVNPVVYYTGNIWYKPGEIVTFSGHQLGEAVEKVELYRLPDQPAGASASYFSVVKYDRNPQSAEYFAAARTDWPTAEAVEAAVLQRTETSVKFRLPAGAKEGVWAVRLSGRGFAPIIRMINVPCVNFALGDEGALVTPGGWIFTAGSNLYPQNPPAAVQLLLKNGEGEYRLTAAEGDPEYAAKFLVPETVRPGEYEISLHNGYGDDTCWSAPLKIKVGASPRDAWPQEVFNVRDYGAVGDGLAHNDTPDIIMALRAAEKNGGGVVYFPRGTYMLTHPLSIPENVLLKGDGIIKTKFIWLPYNWDTDELPDAMLIMTKNVEITGIDFSGTRLGPLFVASGRGSANIYIHHCRVFLTPHNGGPTDAHPIGNNWDTYQLRGLVTKELNSFTNANGHVTFKMYGVDNLQIHDIDSFTQGGIYSVLDCRNVHIAHNKCVGTGTAALGGVVNALVEHTHHSGFVSMLSGDNIYHAHNVLSNNIGNNREIMTSDGPGLYGCADGKLYMETIGEKTYRLRYTYPDGDLVGKQLLILAGPGEGQMRRITANTGDIIELESPFAVAPEDNVSNVSVLSARSNIISAYNHMYNAGDFQYYGTQLNTVAAHNELEKVRGFVAWGKNIYNYIQPNWYISLADNLLWDANFLHHVGYAPGYLKPLSKIDIVGASPLPNNQLCMNVCRNELRDGFFIMIATGKEDNSPITDMVVQENCIKESKFGLYLASLNNGCEGMVFANNHFEEVEKPYIVRRQCLQGKICYSTSQIQFLDEEIDRAELVD